MRSGDNRHLAGSDCEALLRDADGSDLRRQEWDAHLRTCDRCTALMENYQRETDRLKGLRISGRTPSGTDCPDPSRWAQLAAGLETEEESEHLLEHAAGCDACGPHLKVLLEDAAPVDPASEPSMIPYAPNPEFVQRLAADLSHEPSAALVSARPVSAPPRVSTTRPKPRARWILAAAALAAGAGAVLMLRPAWLFGVPPEQLLARAYETNRTWTARIPEASYVPLVSSARSATPRNTPLAEADAAVSAALDRNPGDRRSQVLRARAEFLHHRYDNAIEALRPLADDAALDLGTAYLARGLADDSAGDEENAVEYLSKALQANPRDPVATFNRALAFEALMMWDQAEAEWKRYIQMDSKGGWVEEAQKHLEDTVQKKKPGSAN